MDAEELKARTKQPALDAIRVVKVLPRSREADVLARQLLRSATSVGANYRAACRARSRGEFIANLGVVEEEADECAYWVELLVDSGLMSADRAAAFKAACEEILRIAVASIKTTRRQAPPVSDARESP